MCGNEDKMTPQKFSESLHNNIVNSQLHILESARHMAMVEQPDVVADLLKQFIDNLPPRTRKEKDRLIPEGEAASVQQAESPLTGVL